MDYIAIFFYGLCMAFCVMILHRNNLVWHEKTRVTDIIYYWGKKSIDECDWSDPVAAERNIQEREEGWQLVESIHYFEMLFKFWRPVKWFYAGKLDKYR